MSSSLGTWQKIRGIVLGIALLVPMIQAVAPGLLAFSGDGIWCQTLAPGDSAPATAPGTAEDCLVCLAASIVSSAATPSPLTVPAPRRSLRNPQPESLTGRIDALAAAQPPIRAPPAA